jgi:16S rRNA (cytosine967-C5)-methyltransferase
VSSSVDPARDAAWQLLAAWQDGRLEWLSDGAGPLQRLDGRDAALARELAWGVLRHGELYTSLARRYLRPGKQVEPLLRVLSLVAHQLFGMDRIPPHAAVDSGVQLLRRFGQNHLTGVANAVARRLSELRRDEPATDTVVGPLARIAPSAWPRSLAERHALPATFVTHCQARGRADDRQLSLLLQVPPLCTRSRDGSNESDPAVIRSDGAWHWWRDPQTALQGPVAAGRHRVQDRSQGEVATLAADASNPVLDYCAAPGGKSAALHDLGLRVIAADRRLGKCRSLRELALPVVMHDGRRPAIRAASCGLVVVDAPCSNSGAWARHPEAKHRYEPQALDSLNRLQSQLLQQAAALVRPGGHLLYSTCSLDLSENQDRVAALSGWQRIDERETWPDGWQAGAYAALLQRSEA